MEKQGVRSRADEKLRSARLGSARLGSARNICRERRQVKECGQRHLVFFLVNWSAFVTATTSHGNRDDPRAMMPQSYAESMALWLLWILSTAIKVYAMITRVNCWHEPASTPGRAR